MWLSSHIECFPLGSHLFCHPNMLSLNPCKSREDQKEVLLDLVTVYLAQPTLIYSQNIVSFVKKIEYKKYEYPHLIKTKIGEVSIKLAAEEKMPSFYYENKDEDLIPRELKCRRSCYNKFRLSSVRFDDISDNSESREYQEEGNYNSVTDYVNKHILKEKRAVSIAVLHTTYGLKPNDTRYRSKLKSRLKKEFPTLSFLNIGRNSPDVVMEGSAEFDEITFNDKEGCLIKAAEYLRNGIIK